MAVTPHEAATSAALHIMDDGGNAVDAAVAANAVLGVVLPDTCGPGGDLFALIHVPGEPRPLCLNASGRAGGGADAAALRAQGLATVPSRGKWGVTVPGCVDGWVTMLGRIGSRTLEEVLRPAIAQASAFQTSPELAASLERARPWLATQPSARALYPGGAPPRPGDTLSRPDMAATLDRLASGGREAFFHKVGPLITEATEGLVTADDYGAAQADWVEPLRLDFAGQTGWTVPLNSQGYLTLAAYWIAEHLDPPPDPGMPAYHHALIEAYRALAWERDDTVADPDRAPRTSEELVDPERLAERAAAVDTEQAGTWPMRITPSGGTAYLCTIDDDGLGVSLIQSNFEGIGSGLGAGDSGVFLHNRGAGFSLVPGHPNELAPGRRPLHTLSPTSWTRNGRLVRLLGTRGGHLQPQILLQMAAHLLLARKSLPEAQAEPRWSIEDFGPGRSARVSFEPRFSAAVVAGLADLGHITEIAPEPWMEGWGPVSIIEVDGDGTRRGAADPRVSTTSAGAS